MPLTMEENTSTTTTNKTNNEKEEPVMNLPMSKIKKIVKLDPEHISSTESANFVLGLSTELFIKQFVLDSSEITRSKGRKKIMYADAQKVVSNVDIYSFMRDLVPKRAPIGELMSKGLIKLRPGDEQRMESMISRDGYVDKDEVEGDGEVEVEVEEDDVEGEVIEIEGDEEDGEEDESKLKQQKDDIIEIDKEDDEEQEGHDEEGKEDGDKNEKTGDEDDVEMIDDE